MREVKQIWMKRDVGDYFKHLSEFYPNHEILIMVEKGKPTLYVTPVDASADGWRSTIESIGRRIELDELKKFFQQK